MFDLAQFSYHVSEREKFLTLTRDKVRRSDALSPCDRAIQLDKCQLIHDLSPLGKLEKLEYVRIEWNIRSEALWDMSNNRSLRAIELHDCRTMKQNLRLLSTAPELTDVIVCGSIFGKYPMPSLDVFAKVGKLQYLRLYSIMPERKDAHFMALPGFERYDFSPVCAPPG